MVVNVLIVKRNILAIFLMLMTFNGQAASMEVGPCQMDISQQTVHQNITNMCMASMDHTSSSINDNQPCNSESEINMAEHCEYECHCPFGEIAPAILWAISDNDREMIPFKEPDQSAYLTLMQFPFTLYRPPISL